MPSGWRKTAPARCSNLYDPRGAEVRDANDWAKYIIEADQRFCDKTDVVFQEPQLAALGASEIHDYLLNTAAIYKFIHDLTPALHESGLYLH